jgi:UDP-N-acetylmuramate: L-alanyl-gamma-D-glutamyl-meso-diaminopimelate ligase
MLPADIQKIHIIGVCGTGMGSLAAMLKERGFEVRGSDQMAYPPMSDWLRGRGIEIMLGYDSANLDWDPDLVVVGNVCRRDYADAVAMRERGFAYLSFPEALRHFFMREMRNFVITGTHGKTTTTSMVAWIFHHAGLDPSFMVGGITGNFQSNFRLGNGGVFVVEGDEYDTAYFDKVPKFWHYAPTFATINNLEFDHADIYADVEAIESVFQRFIQMIPEDGGLWINGDDPRVTALCGEGRVRKRTFGLETHNTLHASAIRYGTSTCVDVVYDGQALGEFRLPLIGEFNVRNMLGAIGLGLDAGVDWEVMREAIGLFSSVKKRQELKGEVAGVLVYDDFAHHPTAVGATLRGLRTQFPDRRLWAIFEAKSNTSRRRVFQDAYPSAFEPADRVILSKPWRQDEGLAPSELLDIDLLAETIRGLGPRTDLIPDVEEIVAHVVAEAMPGDVIAGLSGSAFGGLHNRLLQGLRDRFGQDS